MEQKQTKLKAQIKREDQFNWRMELNIRIKELEKELKQMKDRL